MGMTKAQRDVARLRRKWDREEKIEKFIHIFKKPMHYKRIPVPDHDQLTRLLSAFRTAYADYLGSRTNTENSDLQYLSTQLFWHRTYLQKERLLKLGVTLELESERVKRTENPADSIVESDAFDGRYVVSEVNEAIYAKRTFRLDGQDIGTYHDYESADYSILSAKQVGADEIVCPSCGSITSRENLIDGCDYCGTRFTVEDLQDRVNDFSIRLEYGKKGLREEVREIYLREDNEAGAMVRRFDPNFSFRSFRAGVLNKVAAIHFADSVQQISAFSDESLSHLLEEYSRVAYIDFRRFDFTDASFDIKHGLKEKNNYYVEDGVQKIFCRMWLGLYELVDGKIQLRSEIVKLALEKSAECKTQNICGPAVLKCKGCGGSLSLMEGKTCVHCGSELDMRQYDWVITDYTTKFGDLGKSWRTFD